MPEEKEPRYIVSKSTLDRMVQFCQMQLPVQILASMQNLEDYVEPVPEQVEATSSEE